MRLILQFVIYLVNLCKVLNHEISFKFHELRIKRFHSSRWSFGMWRLLWDSLWLM